MASIDVFNLFATDEVAEVEGVWVDLSTATDDGPATRLLIARDGNVDCERLVEQLMSDNADALVAEGAKSKATSRKIEIEVTAKTILKGWENLLYKGEYLPYTEENAIKVLSHKDFRNLVLYHARQRAAYAQKFEDDTVKN